MSAMRNRAGLTQAELSERAGVAVQEISKYENGHRVPTLETLQRLADALSVPLEEVVAENQPSENDALLAGIQKRLREQPARVVRRAAAVLDALIKVG